MNHLLILFSVIFLVAALLGIELGYWLASRKFVDVTEAYKDLRLANARSDVSHWNRLWKRLDAMPEPREMDFTGVNGRIDSLQQQLVLMTESISAIPRPRSIDLSHVHSQLNRIAKELHELKRTEDEESREYESAEDPLDSTDEMPALVL